MNSYVMYHIRAQLQVELDSGEIVNIPHTYKAIDYGYALTVHKSQGMTVEHAKVLIDSKYWDRHLSFVAMTRHKQSLNLYADRINHPNLSDLKRTMSRSITKDNVIDWPLDFAIRAGFNPDKLIGKVVTHLAGLGHKIKNGYNYVVNVEAALLQANRKATYPNKTAFRKAAKQTAANHEQLPLNDQYEALRVSYPVLIQYETLLKQRKHLSGYFREKADKKMQETVINIIEDKNLIAQIKQISPKIANNISKQASDV